MRRCRLRKRSWTVWQRPQIADHRAPILFGQPLHVSKNGRHRGANDTQVGGGSRREEVEPLTLAPVSQAQRGDIGYESNPLRVLPAGITRAFANRTQDVSRGVAFRAMSDALHEIASPVPFSRMRRILGNARGMEKEQFPHADEAPDVEGKRKLVRWRPP